MIEFLREAMQAEGTDREAMHSHRAEKASTAQKQAEVAGRQAVAVEKQTNTGLLRSKAELLDRIIRCNKLVIDLPP
jgi:hypothetical protein